MGEVLELGFIKVVQNLAISKLLPISLVTL